MQLDCVNDIYLFWFLRTPFHTNELFLHFSSLNLNFEYFNKKTLNIIAAVDTSNVGFHSVRLVVKALYNIVILGF